MSITTRELNQLKKIATIANQMVVKAEAAMAAAAAKAVEPVKAPAKKADTKASKKAAPKATKAPKAAAKEVAPKATKVPKAPKAPKPAAPKKAAAKRTRRTGDELVAFRQMLSDERNGGMPVAALAKQHGVSTAYIYSI